MYSQKIIICEPEWYNYLNLVHFVSLQETARGLKSRYPWNFIKSRRIGHHIQGILCKGWQVCTIAKIWKQCRAAIYIFSSLNNICKSQGYQLTTPVFSTKIGAGFVGVPCVALATTRVPLLQPKLQYQHFSCLSTWSLRTEPLSYHSSAGSMCWSDTIWCMHSLQTCLFPR